MWGPASRAARKWSLTSSGLFCDIAPRRWGALTLCRGIAPMTISKCPSLPHELSWVPHPAVAWQRRFLSSSSRDEGEKSAKTESESTETSSEADPNLPKPVSPYNIPNALTITRLVLTPGLCWLILTAQYDAAIVGCFCTGVLDYFDGYLARKWKQQSVLGAFLDPLADKVFVGGIYATLAYQGLIPWELLALVVGRDAGLMGVSFAYRYVTKPPDVAYFATSGKGVLTVQPTALSRVNTVLQMSLLGFALTGASPTFAWPGPEIFQGMCWVVAGTTVASGLSYANMKSLRQQS